MAATAPVAPETASAPEPPGATVKLPRGTLMEVNRLNVPAGRYAVSSLRSKRRGTSVSTIKFSGRPAAVTKSLFFTVTAANFDRSKSITLPAAVRAPVAASVPAPETVKVP